MNLANNTMPPAVPVDADDPALGYAVDVTPSQAFACLQSGDAVLIDVRIDGEREWVGVVPGAIAVAWNQQPGTAVSPEFDVSLKAVVPAGKKVVLLCRSGVRSVAAARRAAELDLEAYNIFEGFEGDPNGQAQRSDVGGWRFRGLPRCQSCGQHVSETYGNKTGKTPH